MQILNKKRRRKINPKEFFRKIFCFIGRKIGWVAFIFFLLAASFCVYIWYSYVYDSQWSEVRKQEYINSKDKDVTFDLVKFHEIVGESENRKQEYSKESDQINDIFRLKK